MNFVTWEPVYEAILADMGYERASDEQARDRLASLVGSGPVLDPGTAVFEDQTVAIAAPGPRLLEDAAVFEAADTVIGAGRAADRLREAGIALDWIVTDLDGHTSPLSTFTAAGSFVAVHAHGDNGDLLAAQVPAVDPAVVVPTTQAAPTGPVRNFGGFTDGDRAAFFADALGAARLRFPGWDLTDRSVDDEKARKLQWAARLLRWLERRRDETFAILDGRRAEIDTSPLPIDE